jgi:hypothetical protein
MWRRRAIQVSTPLERCSPFVHKNSNCLSQTPFMTVCSACFFEIFLIRQFIRPTNTETSLPTSVMTVCKGCGSSFKRSGLFAHLVPSKNPSCQTYLKQIRHDEIFWSEKEDSTDNQNQLLEPDFNVDGHGDIFGDFADYSEADWGMDIDDEDDPTPFSGDDQTSQD